MNLSAGFQFSSRPGCTKSFPTALKQAWPMSPAPMVEVNVVRGSAGKECSSPHSREPRDSGLERHQLFPVHGTEQVGGR